MDQLFKIFKVDIDEANKIKAQPDTPHKHDFEELMIGIKGELEHYIDFDSVKTVAPFISFVTKGKVHRVIPRPLNNQCDIWVIRFKSEFIPETTFQLYSLYHNNASFELKDNSCFTRLIVICNLIHEEYETQNPNYRVIRQLLSVLFTMIEVERTKRSTESESVSRTHNMSFKSFLEILEENYKRPVGVEFYAEKLFMSARNLNLICHNVLEQSVSEIIETRKLIEAKNLLVTTDLTVSEIAYELGYNENAYFSNVFKKKAGQSPSSFRNEMKSLLSS